MELRLARTELEKKFLTDKLISFQGELINCRREEDMESEKKQNKEKQNEKK